MRRIKSIIDKLKFEKYYPKPSRRTYILKKNKKKRPLGISSFTDKLIQEVIRQILEAIYEPLFSKNSHGFRPHKSCHTALMQLKRCNGINWIIEGDITGFFDNINHETLLKILERRIEDGRFIELIRRFLKAGYMENGIKRNSITGTPQGGIISPILSNIYLNELDSFMDTEMENNNRGNKRKRNREYHRLDSLRLYYLRKGNVDKVEHYRKEKMKIPSKDMFDPNYQRVRYIRYADDFIVCINGSKKLALQIKAEVSGFLSEELKLELNEDKTLVTNFSKKKVRFLGYDVHKAKDDSRMIKKDGYKRRSINGVPQLRVPSEIIFKKIKEFTEKKKAIHVKSRINLRVENIINIYNAEIRGLYNYYSLANNVSQQLYRFKYYHYYSMLRTIGAKEKCTVTQVIKKYGIDVRRKIGTGTKRIAGITFDTKEGKRTLTYFDSSIKKKEFPITYNVQPYEYPYSGYCEVLHRLAKRKCELCDVFSSNTNYEVHQIRNLKDEIGKYNGKKLPEWLEVMKQKRRKTLIICEKCHRRIHGITI